MKLIELTRNNKQRSVLLNKVVAWQSVFLINYTVLEGKSTRFFRFFNSAYNTHKKYD